MKKIEESLQKKLQASNIAENTHLFLLFSINLETNGISSNICSVRRNLNKRRIKFSPQQRGGFFTNKTFFPHYHDAKCKKENSQVNFANNSKLQSYNRTNFLNRSNSFTPPEKSFTLSTRGCFQDLLFNKYPLRS